MQDAVLETELTDANKPNTPALDEAGKPKALSFDDAGKPKALPVRTCIATRAAKPIDELIRFVRGPDKTLVPDLKAGLPGRGVWVSANRAALEKAIRGKAFSYALKAEIITDAALPEKVGQLLRQRALSALSFANKAGEIVFGMTKIEKALEASPLALIHSSEASPDGVEKLDRRFHFIKGKDAPVFRIFSGEELDMAFGRSNVIHAALMDSQAAGNCLKWLEKAAAFEKEPCGVNEQE